MLAGSDRSAIDGKGRVVVPSKLRAALPDGDLVVCWEPDGCLSLYTLEVWKERVRRIDESSRDVMEARMRKRFLFARTEVVRRDPQGRVSLPKHLLQEAGIEGEAVVVGVGNRIELWAPAKWEALMARQQTIIEHNPGEILTP